MEPIARIRFSWDAELTKCRATAFDLKNTVLGDATIELTPETARRIWARGGSAQFRVEDLLEQHLRAVLEMRE